MTDTLENVAAEDEKVDQQRLAEQLLAQAKEQGVELVGPNGLLNQLTKKVLETALEEEMSEHLGYDACRGKILSQIIFSPPVGIELTTDRS